MFQSPMLREPVVHPLAEVRRAPTRPSPFASSICGADLVDGDQPVVGDAEDERRVAAPAVRDRRARRGRPRRGGRAPRGRPTIWSAASRVESAVQPAVVVVEAAGLVDRHQHRQAVLLRELEVLAAAAGRDVDDARALVERDVVPGDHAVVDRAAGAERVERPLVAQADELLAAHPLRRSARPDSARRRPSRRSRCSPYSASGFTAAATFAGSVHGVVVQTTSASPRPVEERQADEERRVGALLVDARLRELVLARATCRSAGTTPSSGGRGRASRARGRS